MIAPTLTPLSEADKKKIVDKLTEKGVRAGCPMCGHRNFVLADGYLNHPIQSNPKAGFVFGGPSIPTIAIICSNCGFTSQHALGVLGLLDLLEGGQQ
ncbi:MAG: hypothetical protein HBSIN02_25370 [Bacteroidia bacterium]|nr:MAG: hypothetical protein HBSIN02_25370 [Bacteroidia bacterium]